MQSTKMQNKGILPNVLLNVLVQQALCGVLEDTCEMLLSQSRVRVCVS